MLYTIIKSRSTPQTLGLDIEVGLIPCKINSELLAQTYLL